MSDAAAAYLRAAEAVRNAIRRENDRITRMQAVCDATWLMLREHGISWVGFYLVAPDESNERCLILGPHQPKPACSPLALHGICGQTLLFGCTRIVEDAHHLPQGEYIACDPEDRSEIAIPLIEDDNGCWGVFDLDSHDVGRFTDVDAEHLRRILHAADFRTD